MMENKTERFYEITSRSLDNPFKIRVYLPVDKVALICGSYELHAINLFPSHRATQSIRVSTLPSKRHHLSCLFLCLAANSAT